MLRFLGFIGDHNLVACLWAWRNRSHKTECAHALVIRPHTTLATYLFGLLIYAVIVLATLPT
jgi:hypothetical protein